MTPTHILQQEEMERRRMLGLPEPESLFTNSAMVNTEIEKPQYTKLNKDKNKYSKMKRGK